MIGGGLDSENNNSLSQLLATFAFLMVGVGLGWSVLPATLFDESLSSIKISGFTANRSLGIVTHKNRTLSQAAQKMVNLIQKI